MLAALFPPPPTQVNCPLLSTDRSIHLSVYLSIYLASYLYLSIYLQGSLSAGLYPAIKMQSNVSAKDSRWICERKATIRVVDFVRVRRSSNILPFCRRTDKAFHRTMPQHSPQFQQPTFQILSLMWLQEDEGNSTAPAR